MEAEASEVGFMGDTANSEDPGMIGELYRCTPPFVLAFKCRVESARDAERTFPNATPETICALRVQRWTRPSFFVHEDFILRIARNF